MNKGTPPHPMTLMDPQMDPKIDPARLIFGDPCPKKARQDPSKVNIGQFLIDLSTTEKFKFTAI